MSLKYSLADAVREGRVHGCLTIEVNKLPVTVAAVGAAVGFGTAVLGDLPTGALFISGVKASLAFESDDADLINTWEGDFSIGTDPTADVTLSGTEVNLVPSTAVGPAVLTGTQKKTPAATGRLATAINFDNTSGNAEVNLNLLVDAASITDGASAVILATGFVKLMLGVIP